MSVRFAEPASVCIYDDRRDEDTNTDTGKYILY